MSRYFSYSFRDCDLTLCAGLIPAYTYVFFTYVAITEPLNHFKYFDKQSRTNLIAEENNRATLLSVSNQISIASVASDPHWNCS